MCHKLRGKFSQCLSLPPVTFTFSQNTGLTQTVQIHMDNSIYCAQLLLVRVNFTFNHFTFNSTPPQARLPLNPVVSGAQKIIRYRWRWQEIDLQATKLTCKSNTRKVKLQLFLGFVELSLKSSIVLYSFTAFLAACGSIILQVTLTTLNV